jgi:hypothetical protein
MPRRRIYSTENTTQPATTLPKNDKDTKPVLPTIPVDPVIVPVVDKNDTDAKKKVK